MVEKSSMISPVRANKSISGKRLVETNINFTSWKYNLYLLFSFSGDRAG